LGEVLGRGGGKAKKTVEAGSQKKCRDRGLAIRREKKKQNLQGLKAKSRRRPTDGVKPTIGGGRSPLLSRKKLPSKGTVGDKARERGKKMEKIENWAVNLVIWGGGGGGVGGGGWLGGGLGGEGMRC